MLTCNINRKGRWVRGLSGSCALAAGVAATLLWWPPLWWQWLIGGVLVSAGLFQLFEAFFGWCAIRALGFRTPV